MDIQQAQRELLARLIPIYGEREAAQIGDLVMENITGKRKIDRLLNKDVMLSPFQTDIFHQYIFGLSKNQPVQYVLRESWFCGMKFYVDQHVLIPRPETEELVEWVTSESTDTPLSILDVGTGSGCIAISLKKKLPAATVHACDISPDALTVARRNAADLEADVDFQLMDILDSRQREYLPTLDLIVSNPPYIPLRDKSSMSPHVVEYEPHIALFVKDEDPVVFYQAIAQLGRERLSPTGALYAEIHEDLAGQVVAAFKKAGYQNIVVKQDMQGKDRMIKATM
ncbi:MAG: protein-(glutamine-N5) methyltransferase, release factor-specific [Sphingobacteriales bacterium 50-39]|nr:peptide chain release factor N(5)-glutamine methyltransferase [Sphingobacteriales bacterium]OJW60685.1 MAG: protein-(glutamine-N5) methyltransferase, release factor-specific [Sphingobacteriales bacterium 50-39]